jgi:hypothetical protein
MTDYVEVEFESSCPEFMGTDLESYGPFEEGDTAEIPEDNAEILVNRGQAEEHGKPEQEEPEENDESPAGERLWP